MTTHYDVLGISAAASPDAVKRAYYRRARAYHPDAHAGSTSALIDEAERAMAALNTAWSVLRDSEARRAYDEQLAGAAQAKNPRPGRRPAKQSPTEILGAGFSYWMGGVGSTANGVGERRVALSVNGATSFAPLKSLAPDRLWSLHAQRSSIDDDELVHLQGMTDLLHLDLSHTPVTDAGLLHLQGLDRLEVLDLWNTGVSDAGLALIARLPSIVQLGLGNTQVTDAGLEHLVEMKQLRLVQLWGTKVTNQGRRRMRRVLSDATIA